MNNTGRQLTAVEALTIALKQLQVQVADMASDIELLEKEIDVAKKKVIGAASGSHCSNKYDLTSDPNSIFSDITFCSLRRARRISRH